MSRSGHSWTWSTNDIVGLQQPTTSLNWNIKLVVLQTSACQNPKSLIPKPRTQLMAFAHLALRDGRPRCRLRPLSCAPQFPEVQRSIGPCSKARSKFGVRADLSQLALQVPSLWYLWWVPMVGSYGSYDLIRTWYLCLGNPAVSLKKCQPKESCSCDWRTVGSTQRFIWGGGGKKERTPKQTRQCHIQVRLT